MTRSLLFPLLLLPLACLAGETTITQSHQTFDPDSVTLQPGDVLHFDNADDVKHNIHVSADGGPSEDLGLQKPGESVSYSFSKPGEYKISCSIHPKMRLKVLVE